jgi:hypothetical protein
LCLGVATTATQGTAVGLGPCGVDSKTVWITVSGASSSNGYDLLMTGTNTRVSGPYVLTAGAIGDGLTITELSVSNHLVSSTQMWQNKSGVL